MKIRIIDMVRYPDEPPTPPGYVSFDDRISYEDALTILSDPVLGDPNELAELEAEKARREK